MSREQKQKLLLMLSQTLIGTGFFFLYVQHVRSIFESRTNIAHLSQLERESLMRREDALYYSFYKTLTEEPDFWSGYEKLKNVTTIEYPHSVNVLQRFHVLPELTIAYIYHIFRRRSSGQFLFLSCWRASDMRLHVDHRHCDLFSQPMQFYLEFVWFLGGMTVLIIYMYGTLLSENVFGGIYAAVSYIMFHSFAAKIYERPVARENFAFPVIFLQMLFLSICIERITKNRERSSRLFIIIKLTVLAAIALLCWQFSAIIFATQILILMLPSKLYSGSNAAISAFIIDYTISQLLGNLLAYYLSFSNRKYIFAWQIGPAIGLFFINIVRRVNSLRRNNEFSLQTIAFGVSIAISAQGTLIDLLEKTGLARSIDNSFALYRDLIVHWGLQAKVNFTTSLAACNPDYARMTGMDLWVLIKTLIVKPYCMYGVVMLARFFRNLRTGNETKTPDTDHVERAKKYVLEDFLEENHISMRDMSNKETENELNKFLKLLEECHYDYERYKGEKAKMKKDLPDEHTEFINDIRKLKEEINELNDKKNKQQEESRKEQAAKVEAEFGLLEEATEESKLIAIGGDVEADVEQALEPNQEQEECCEQNIGPATADDAELTPNLSSSDNRSQQQQQQDKQEQQQQPQKNDLNTGNRRTRAEKSNSKRSAQSNSTSSYANASCENDFFTFHYLYSFLQMAVFTVIGLSIKKLFFLSFTQGCVIAPTLCSKFGVSQKQGNIFWTVALAVFLTSIFYPGMTNIREEYFPTRFSNAKDDLDTMLEWIKMNTEKDAVFAGPIDIIGTVHLTTKRPIVNHAHLEMRHISDITEHVYSVFSRQQSSDIYNQCSQLKIQYLIISTSDCLNEIKDDCDMLSIWDEMQPAYRKYPQFCYELATKNVPSFLKVFSNDFYGIIKMFSQSVQINLKYSKMAEKVM